MVIVDLNHYYYYYSNNYKKSLYLNIQITGVFRLKNNDSSFCYFNDTAKIPQQSNDFLLVSKSDFLNVYYELYFFSYVW